MSGNYTFARKTLVRLTRVMLLLDAGRITKNQYGVYQYHDAPVTTVVREMRVSLGGAGVSLTRLPVVEAPKAMPNFDNIFGGK